MHNADKNNFRSEISMNTKYMFIVAVIAATLLGTTAVTADSAYAYEKNQAVSQANACGNGELPLNVFCQNLLSQIQGDGNAANVIGVQ
jgi:hypothetical protein